MPFSWQSSSKPLIILSPMAGYTDSAFKQIVRILCPEAVVVTEFVSTDAVYYGSEKTMRMMAFFHQEHPVILQVFGKNPDRFVHTAKIAEQMGYDGIDINMGCPARKVIGSDHGSALVKIENRCTAMQIVSEMTKAVKIPISVKTRLGWENADELVGFCKELEQAGCQSICIHGRTTKQGYRGDANWDPIYEVKRQVNIPVFGNGDITSVSAFRQKLGNLSGVFVGRAAIGDPWIIQDLVQFLNIGEASAKPFFSRDRRPVRRGGRTLARPPSADCAARRQKLSKKGLAEASYSDSELDELFPRAENIPWEKKKPIALKHFELAVQIKGEKLGVLEMRKHLAAYIKGHPQARSLREHLMKAESKNAVDSILNPS